MMEPRQEAQAALFYEFSLDARVPQDQTATFCASKLLFFNRIGGEPTFAAHANRPSGFNRKGTFFQFRILEVHFAAISWREAVRR